MSYIMSRIQCQKCKEIMNVAFGMQGLTQIAGHPKKCPECGSSKLEHYKDGWGEPEPIKKTND